MKSIIKQFLKKFKPLVFVTGSKKVGKYLQKVLGTIQKHMKQKLKLEYQENLWLPQSQLPQSEYYSYKGIIKADWIMRRIDIIPSVIVWAIDWSQATQEYELLIADLSFQFQQNTLQFISEGIIIIFVIFMGENEKLILEHKQKTQDRMRKQFNLQKGHIFVVKQQLETFEEQKTK